MLKENKIKNMNYRVNVVYRNCTGWKSYDKSFVTCANALDYAWIQAKKRNSSVRFSQDGKYRVVYRGQLYRITMFSKHPLKRMKKKEAYWYLEKLQAFNQDHNLVIVEKYM